jgi:hypothetical protein
VPDFAGQYQDSLPEWSKGVDSSSTSASCVGSNPTAVSCGLGKALAGALRGWCSQRKTTPRGFEPLRAEPNGFLVHHLNHSVTVSCQHHIRTRSRLSGCPQANGRWPWDFGLHGPRGWCSLGFSRSTSRPFVWGGRRASCNWAWVHGALQRPAVKKEGRGACRLAAENSFAVSCPWVSVSRPFPHRDETDVSPLGSRPFVRAAL